MFLQNAIAMVVTSSAAAEALAGGLGNILHVVYTPLRDAVASLDTSQERWMLYLDSDSPAEDHCWAMLDVLGLLVLGMSSSTEAVRAAPLRLVGG